VCTKKDMRTLCNMCPFIYTAPLLLVCLSRTFEHSMLDPRMRHQMHTAAMCAGQSLSAQPSGMPQVLEGGPSPMQVSRTHRPTIFLDDCGSRACNKVQDYPPHIKVVLHPNKEGSSTSCRLVHSAFLTDDDLRAKAIWTAYAHSHYLMYLKGALLSKAWPL
jgi:hypothetical protein